MIENKDYEAIQETENIELLNFFRIFWKRRWLVLMVTVVVLAAAAVKTFTSTPIYTAMGTLLIERESNILTFDEIFQIEASRDDYYQTQCNLLHSYAMAEKTVEKLGLVEKAALKANANLEKKNARPVDVADPGLKRGLAESLMRRTAIKPVAKTRLVEVDFNDPDPEMAAATVNALFEAFIDMNIEAKYEATAQASEFLKNQIGTLRSEIETAQQKLQSYGAAKNIIALSDKETTTIEKLGELNRALTEAVIERIKNETYYNETKIASTEYTQATRSNPMIQRLREIYVGLSRDYQKKSGTYGSEYPEMQRLKSELETTRQALESETGNLSKGAYADYQAALKREQSLTRVFNEQKKEAERLNSNAIAYFSLKSDIVNKNNLLDLLMKRESETGVSARLRGLRTSNIRIGDRARVPAAPSSPNNKKNMLLALLFGFCGGIGIAYLLDRFDNSLKTSDDVSLSADLPTLGTIPEFSGSSYKKNNSYGYEQRSGYKKRKRSVVAAPRHDAGAGGKAAKDEKPVTQIELITHYAPMSYFSESYRSFRTEFLLSSAGPCRKTVVFSSCLPSEGKSVTASNFAVTLTQNNKRVLIMDTDLHKPRQHRIFGVKNLQGLTNFLTNGMEIKDLIKKTEVNNLFLIVSGPIPPNPADLLGSAKMATLLAQLKQFFDYIVMDSPPLMVVSDAQIIAPLSDGVIIVVRSGKTPREALRTVKQKLVLTNSKILGVLINQFNPKNQGYYSRQHYYQEYGAGDSAWN